MRHVYERQVTAMKLLRIVVCLGVLLWPPYRMLAQGGPSPTLLVLSKGDLALEVVDPSTMKVLWTVPSGPDPHEVAASPDGRFAYISNYGSGAYHTITPVDLQTRKALTPIDLGALTGPHGLDYVGGKLWFTAEGAKVFGSYDPATQKIDFVIGTGQDRTHMVRVSNDQQRMVLTNVASATVTIVEKIAAGRGGPPPGPPGGPQRGGNPPAGAPGGPARRGGPPGGPGPQANWQATVVPVGRGDEGFDMTPDWREAWIANAQDGTISIIDLNSKRVVQTLQSNTQGANRLKITPDGKLAFVSTLSGPDLAVFDVAGRKEVTRIKIGNGAAGIQIQPDGSRVYVACTPDNYVAVIDVKSLKVIGQINAGPQPDGLWWVGR
jgi:YVTN family beta-propeller protein